MVINYDENKLKTASQDFYNVTGLGILIFHSNLVPFDFKYTQNEYCKFIQKTKEGILGCYCSDRSLLEKCRQSRKTEMHICHAGLADVVVPIMYEQDVVAYILIGQMKINASFEDAKKRISAACSDIDTAKKHYDKIALFDDVKIKSVVNLATMLAQHILFENILKPKQNRDIETAVDFINNNLDKRLSVEHITQSINISKNVLYKNFHERFGCTVNSYITEKRIEKSIELLTYTDLSVEEISQPVGFSSAAYYSANFKKLKGVSPLKYRKNAS